MSFFVQKLYQILNHLLLIFDYKPPTLAEYLLLDEQHVLFQEIIQADLIDDV